MAGDDGGSATDIEHVGFFRGRLGITAAVVVDVEAQGSESRIKLKAELLGDNPIRALMRSGSVAFSPSSLGWTDNGALALTLLTVVVWAGLALWLFRRSASEE